MDFTFGIWSGCSLPRALPARKTDQQGDSPGLRALGSTLHLSASPSSGGERREDSCCLLAECEVAPSAQLGEHCLSLGLVLLEMCWGSRRKKIIVIFM